MFWVCSCILSCCGVIVIVGIAVQAGIIQAAEKCVCENGGAIYNPVTQKCVAGSPSYTCETIKQHQDFIALYSLHTFSAILSCFACMYGRELAQTKMFVTMQTEYVAAPVGTIAVDTEQGADYAELK